MTTAKSKPGAPLAELSAPVWFGHADQVIRASLWQLVRALPAAMGLVARTAWRADRAAVSLGFGAQVVSGVVTAMGLLAVTGVLTSLFVAGPTPDRLVAAAPSLVVLAVAYALRGVADTVVSGATLRLRPKVRHRVERDLAETMSRIDLVTFDEPDFHDGLERSRHAGMDAVDSATHQAIVVVGGVISLVATAATAALLHPLLLPILLLSVAPETWATLRTARLEYEFVATTIETRRRRSLTTDLLAHKESAAEVRVFGAQPFLLAEHDRHSRVMEDAQIALGARQTRVALLGRALSGVGITLAYVTLGWLLYIGATPLAVAGAALLAIRTVRASLTQVVLAANRMFEKSLYINDLITFFDHTERRTKRPTGRIAPVDPEVIAVRGVSFSYPGATRPALDDIDLTIRRGQVVALVGENGSGKSTLAKLLAGLYQPATGSIAWDGVDLATVDAPSVAANVAVVMQEPTRWPLTARHAVTLGRPHRMDPGDRHLAQVARDSGADAVVTTLTHGWDSLLTTRFRDGHDLSGGQWQRLSVARALYRDAPILICDEPTAALDARAEAAVYESLRTLQSGRTVVLITHRLASARQADLIVVMHQGRILQTGTHPHLLATNPHYADLYTLQANSYRDTPTSQPT
ncbi:ABC-type multidrug transport system fused ATPase/permease subunit [Actinokineospora baliensis]|uniref:ABC transporter ATP-binding protein n=1 Tax=Actinokineospora baliensis TaxID=547056 RepID=UPI00195EBFA6|nr:ABC transporter ATP-binding protein [Actinokineospora baliensis]MBM7776554.1 ABC-type multidrug transport system fused ATPase/permease subunit [Actinokineospora baliensis]